LACALPLTDQRRRVPAAVAPGASQSDVAKARRARTVCVGSVVSAEAPHRIKHRQRTDVLSVSQANTSTATSATGHASTPASSSLIRRWSHFSLQRNSVADADGNQAALGRSRTRLLRPTRRTRRPVRAVGAPRSRKPFLRCRRRTKGSRTTTNRRRRRSRGSASRSTVLPIDRSSSLIPATRISIPTTPKDTHP
jgi:hypothetical protein